MLALEMLYGGSFLLMMPMSLEPSAWCINITK